MWPTAFSSSFPGGFVSSEPPHGTPRRERLGFGGVGGRRAPPGSVAGVGTVGTEGCEAVPWGCEVMLSVASGTTSMFGGFHQWRYPHSWMVFVREKPDDLGVALFSGNLHTAVAEWTMVYGRYNELVFMGVMNVYKPTNIAGGHRHVCVINKKLDHTSSH